MSRDPFSWWYSTTEIARRLGKHPKTIAKAQARGELTGGVLLCGQWHFPWESVAKFMGLQAPPLPNESDPWDVVRARTVGELRRRVDRLHQTLSSDVPETSTHNK